jgi:pimeloyl-ACP methyl ester carboxylesterase
MNSGNQAGLFTEHRLEREGRTIAWTEFGSPDGLPIIRFPGTPSCRIHLPLERHIWLERGLRCITTERPGFGQSTRLPNRRFQEHADDVAAILDASGIEKAYITGISGGGPHVLAFAAAYPDRVAAASIVSGNAPLDTKDASATWAKRSPVSKTPPASRVANRESSAPAFRCGCSSRRDASVRVKPSCYARTPPCAPRT